MKFASAIVAAAVLATVMPAHAASITKKYSYFSVRGATLAELERDLIRRGPKVNSTGQRHPGATQMEFETSVSYAQSKRYCRIEEATVLIKAKIFLPRWRTRRRADRETRIVWDTLSADIKRHEESHVIIAKNHGREMEQALEAMGRAKSCEALEQKGQKVMARILQKHDRAQEKFDRVEGINFEARMLRLLKYRIERIENGRLDGG